MNFNNGNDNNNNKNNNNYVRAVRGGKCSLLSFESVYRAYLDCRKRKRGTINALRFEINLMENLFDLTLDLQKGRYRPSRSVCFITRSPKLREIFAADFRDRIIHHLVVRELEKIWEPRFIHDSYASRKGKGIHEATRRLQSFMQKETKSGKRAAYFLQLDIRSFFMSIDKEILFGMFKHDPKISSELLELLNTIIFHDPTTNYRFKGDKTMLERIPPHKSLFTVGPGKGLPIGNLTSQFFANVYLNEMDQFIKHEIKCRHYLRYVDDFILLAPSAEELTGWQQRISEFLNDRLRLSIKEGSRIKRVSEGADFLGYIVRPNYVLVRNRVVNNLKYRLAKFRGEMVKRESRGIAGRPDKPGYCPESSLHRLVVKPERAVLSRQTVASYLGHFSHADSRRLVENLFKKNPWLMQVFVWKKEKLILKAVPGKLFPTMRAQVAFFQRHFSGYVLFFRVGRFVELYGKDAVMMHRLKGFELKKNHRGLPTAVGFPRQMAEAVKDDLLGRGYRTAMITEGPVGGAVKNRHVCELAIKITPPIGRAGAGCRVEEFDLHPS